MTEAAGAAPDPVTARIRGGVGASQQGLAQANLHTAIPRFRPWLRAHPPAQNYIWGRHTEAIVAALQKAADIVEKGGREYLIITVPPRHGKSDLVSRSFPAWYLLTHPEDELLLATYGAELSEGFSRQARRKFLECAPEAGLAFAEDLNQVGAWALAGHRGAMYAVGLGGAITGRGAHVLVIDDYCKNREEAESATIRDRVWDSFRNDLITRLAPAHAVVIVATRWHEDDLVGRIAAAMDADPEFPKFERLTFPACGEARTPDPRPQTPDPVVEWLFPERFSPQWYLAQRAAVGSYAWQALYQGDPRPRTGRLLRTDLAEIVPPERWPWIGNRGPGTGNRETRIGDRGSGFGDRERDKRATRIPIPESRTPIRLARLPIPDPRSPVRWVRAWDLASTEAERLKADPDYTVGTLAAHDGTYLWIADVIRGQWAAPERDRRMVETAQRDGPGVPVVIEVVAGYKDTFRNIQATLRGKARVMGITPRGDKLVRWGVLEPLFEAGRVRLLQAPWNQAFLAELSAVPKCRHDDQADSAALAASQALVAARGCGVSR